MIYFTVMTVKLDCKSLPEIIKSTRKKAGISQIELAELAGVGKTLVFNLENGHISVHLDIFLKVLGVLNIKIQLETPE